MDNNNKTHFIRTSDEETKKKLEELGYQLISYDSKSWTFLNDTKLVFDGDNQKIVHTNALSF